MFKTRRRARGSSDRVEVRREDFSRTPGTYDAIVSIEMIESIPRARWHELFRVFADRLAPSRSIGLQAITVGDRHWASSNANPDLVRRYVFPGGQVPSPGVLRADAAGADSASSLARASLSYCEGGFRSGRTDVSQIVLEPPS